MKLPRLSVHAVVLIILGTAFPAHATQYWDKAALLGDFFKGATSVPYKRVTLSAAEVVAIEKNLHANLGKQSFNIYFGEDVNKKRLGYAVLDAELGLHDLIDFGVRFDLKGRVERVEIVEYREPYGEQVKEPSYRNQFVGKTAKDPITIGQDINIITGASISSKSVALGVKRNVLVLETALTNGHL